MHVFYPWVCCYHIFTLIFFISFFGGRFSMFLAGLFASLPWGGVGLFDCGGLLKCLYTISPFSCLLWESIVEFVNILRLFSHFQLTVRELIWDITGRYIHSYDKSRENVSPDKHVLLTDLIWSPPGLGASIVDILSMIRVFLLSHGNRKH